MFYTTLRSVGDTYKLSVGDSSVDSALHAACRFTMHHGMYKTLPEDDSGRLEDCIPCTVSDVHQFSKMVYAVRNTYFNVPNSMMYPKFRYTLRELTCTTQIPQIMYLDPLLQVDDTERIDGLRHLSPEWTKWASNLTVFRVVNKASHILTLPLSNDTEVTVENTLLSVGRGSNIHMTFKEFYVRSVATERDRLYLLRLLAAESQDVAPRSMLLLIDDSIPLEIIPGFTLPDTVVAKALENSQ